MFYSPRRLCLDAVTNRRRQEGFDHKPRCIRQPLNGWIAFPGTVQRESGAFRQEGRSGGERNSIGGGRFYGVTLIQIHSEKHKGTGKANRERVSQYSFEARLDQDCNTKWQGLSLRRRCSHNETFLQFADEQRRRPEKFNENGPGVLKQTTHSSLQVWKHFLH